MFAVDGDSKRLRVHLDFWCAGIADHVALADLADVVDWKHLPFQPKALLDASSVGGSRYERHARGGQRVAISGEHWPIVGRLRSGQRRVRVAHDAPADEAILDDELRLGAEE